MERDAVAGMTVGSLQKVADALEGRLRLDLEWRGASLDRLVDADHAALAELVARLLTHWGWLVLAEASFNHYGDRGRYDLLAFHPAHGVLLVVEIKTSIGDMQDTLGRLDVKVRLAPQVARERGWPAGHVVPLLVVAHSEANRRHVRGHPALFSGFPVRGRSALAWLRRPVLLPQVGLLMFMKTPNSHRVSTNSRICRRTADIAHPG